ncbi:enoyl- hydratase isomerase family [Colletotrichum truncatum]|uniref:Enoyl- hydratase isomerase family n=1 Tax=Colletotrichum truncatum TaxID=5467 RepID=A0ACC3YWX9_COLTU|nr:enoyl- hydratase isomerase family [Colletotrichum truncatum]KAF6781534.1 enoyl- hydratase isomerase family [Colletotrichum truncatum]
MTATTTTTELPAAVETHVASVPITTQLDLAPPLLPVEQVGPKGWVRVIFHFELSEDYDIDHLTHLLQTSYKAMKARVPIAGCEAVPLQDSKQAGLFRLRYYGDEIEDFLAKDLRGDANFPSFSELKARGFPASALDPAILCRRGLGGEWPQAGDRMNVTWLQATFIRGGLLLNLMYMHAYADGTTAYKFTELLAEEVRRAQGIPIPEPAEIPVEDRAKLLKSTGLRAGRPEDHAEYVELPFTPEGVPPKLAEPNHHGHIFYFSPESLAALKKDASPSNAKLFKTKEGALPPYITTNDAISALLWRATMSAQQGPKFRSATEDSTPSPSIVGIALDARRRAGVPVHKHTLGNILGFAPAILDIREVIAEDSEVSLADLAIAVRQAVAKTEGAYLDSVTALVERLQDVRRLTATMFLDTPGNYMNQSSWRDFPFYDIQWGPAFGGKMLALRPPSVGVCHTMQIVLPDPQRGGVEVYMGVLDEAMEALLKDPVLRKYAQAPEGL